MADKECDGVEKGMDTPDVETPEGGSQTIESELEEGLTGDKPEQQTSGSKKTEDEGSPGDAKGMKSENHDKLKKNSNKFQIFLSIVQVLASMATIAVAFLTFFTLREMQTERDSAYRPEIVVMRNLFEGGEAGSSDSEISGKRIYFDPYTLGPPWILRSKDALSKNDVFYFETPYLTLKNIGQGTAKDIKVTVHIDDWVKNAVVLLNNFSDLGIFEFEECEPSDTSPQARFHVLYRESMDENPSVCISSYEELEKENTKITYITSGADTVNVSLPDSLCKMLAVFYVSDIQIFTLIPKVKIPPDAEMSVEIPDLVITIQYADMQGKQYKQEETIPIVAYCKYVHTTTPSGEEEDSLHLCTGIYEDYIR